MEADGITYRIPHPIVARVIMVIAGLIAISIAPYELWRGLWPINLTTPFFGIIVAGAIAVGLAFIQGGLMAPALQLVFRPGRLEVIRQWPWRIQVASYATESVVSVTVEERESSEGPNDWHAVIMLSDGTGIPSRPLATQRAAEELADKFRSLLASG